jgi:hypothetical protein
MDSNTDFAAWKAIAVAVAIGRQQAMTSAGVNRPFGKKYAAAINLWPEDNGFRNIPDGVRGACCALADNMTAIEKWRASAACCALGPKITRRSSFETGPARRRFHHPGETRLSGMSPQR